MKTKWINLSSLAVIVMALSFFMVSCEKDELSRGGGQTLKGETVIFEVDPYDDYDCGEKEVTLWAGQHIDAGTVTVTDDGAYLCFKYKLDLEDAEFGELHLWVGTDVSTLPTNPQGVPVPGQFPYNEDATGETEFTICVPLEDFVWECDITKFYFVAHAEIYYLDEVGERTGDDDTAFGGEYPGDSPRWYFWDYYVICCDDNGNGDECIWKEQTAYGGVTGGGGDAWWFAFDTEDGSPQGIYAGQKLVDGAYVEWDAETDILTIVLGPNMRLQEDEDNEQVKVEGYDELPGSRPVSGLFNLYKGPDLVIYGNGSRYYVIHLDVEVWTCDEED